MRLIHVGALPASALEAATEFHARVLPKVLALLRPPGGGEDIVLAFPSASYDHRGWRLAAVQDLARAAAPLRVNGLMGDEDAALADTLAFLADAPGITGQLLAVDGKSGETR